MKQVILVRQDLKLPPGKLAAQAAHASVSCFAKANMFVKRTWMHTGMKKIVLKVKDLDELQLYISKAKKARLVTSIIADAGRTVVESGTVTCGGIGPHEDEKIDAITRDLKLMQ